MEKIKRLFIDSDVIMDDEYHSSQRIVERILDKKKIACCPDVFDAKQDFAWHEADSAWLAVKAADEIYGNTSLVPLCGYGSYTGSPVVMNVMMKKAMDENVTGKRVYFLRPMKDIEFDQIDLDLLRLCFGKLNELYTTEFNDKRGYYFKKVNPAKIKP